MHKSDRSQGMHKTDSLPGMHKNAAAAVDPAAAAFHFITVKSALHLLSTVTASSLPCIAARVSPVAA